MLLVQNWVKVNANFRTYGPIALCLFFTFVICVICRKTFRKAFADTNRDISKVMLDTLGALISMNPNVRIQNRPERILHHFLIVFAMVFSMLASAIFLGNILTKETQIGINTLAELVESNWPLCISEELNQTRAEWTQNLE